MSEPLYKLYCGDCLEVLRTLPDCSVDAVVTDPPYLTTDLAFDKVELTNEWIVECLRVLKPNGYLISFNSIENLAEIAKYMKMRWNGVWIKPMGVPVFHNSKKPSGQIENYGVFCKQECKVKELIYNNITYVADPYEKRQKNYQYKRQGKDQISRINYGAWSPEGNIITNNGDRKYTNALFFNHKNTMPIKDRTEHPTQKPVGLLSILIQQTTNEGALILDPFMGSGSTCIAALEFNRRFIGCEIDPAYFEIAKNRIEKHQSELRLF